MNNITQFIPASKLAGNLNPNRPVWEYQDIKTALEKAVESTKEEMLQVVSSFSVFSLFLGMFLGFLLAFFGLFLIL